MVREDIREQLAHLGVDFLEVDVELLGAHFGYGFGGSDEDWAG